MTRGETCIAIRLQWISGHCDAAGNDAADRRAREAASPENPTLSLLCLLERNLSSEMRVAVNGRKNGVKERQPSSQYRQRTTSHINQTTLPIDLQKWGYLLTPIRTGHCWLSTYATAFRFQNNDRYVCGDRETVIHVL